MFSDEFIFLPGDTLRVSSDSPEKACHTACSGLTDEGPWHVPGLFLLGPSTQQRGLFLGDLEALCGRRVLLWPVHAATVVDSAHKLWKAVQPFLVRCVRVGRVGLPGRDCCDHTPRALWIYWCGQKTDRRYTSSVCCAEERVFLHSGGVGRGSEGGRV